MQVYLECLNNFKDFISKKLEKFLGFYQNEKIASHNKKLTKPAKYTSWKSSKTEESNKNMRLLFSKLHGIERKMLNVNKPRLLHLTKQYLIPVSTVFISRKTWFTPSKIIQRSIPFCPTSFWTGEKMQPTVKK